GEAPDEGEQALAAERHVGAVLDVARRPEPSGRCTPAPERSRRTPRTRSRGHGPIRNRLGCSVERNGTGFSDPAARRRPLSKIEPPEEDLTSCPRHRCPPWCDRYASWRRPATPPRRPTPTCWSASVPPATRPPSPRWCGATAPWSWASAGACCATTRTLKTPSRPPSSSSPAKLPRSVGGRRWPAGCTAWPGASPRARGGRRPRARAPGGGGRTWGTRHPTPQPHGGGWRARAAQRGGAPPEH